MVEVWFIQNYNDWPMGYKNKNTEECTEKKKKINVQLAKDGMSLHNANLQAIIYEVRNDS